MSHLGPGTIEEPLMFDDNTFLKSLYEIGAMQLYREKTGNEAIQDKGITQEAQEYIDTLLSPIDFANRANWEANADLEKRLMDAVSRSIKWEDKQKDNR